MYQMVTSGVQLPNISTSHHRHLILTRLIIVVGCISPLLHLLLPSNLNPTIISLPMIKRILRHLSLSLKRCIVSIQVVVILHPVECLQQPHRAFCPIMLVEVVVVPRLCLVLDQTNICHGLNIWIAIQVLVVVLQVIGAHTVVLVLLMEHSIEGSARLIIHLILKHQLGPITIIGNIVQDLKH